MPMIVSRLTSDHALAVFNLHQAIYEELRNDELYRARTFQRIQSLFGRSAICFGAFLEGALVGYSGVRFPDPGDATLGVELGITPARLGLVAEFDGSCVLPGYRGHGIQRDLIQARLNASLARGRPMTIAGVAVSNYHSLANFCAQGMHGVAIHRMADGFERIMVARDYSRAPFRPTATRNVECRSMSPTAIKELLSSGAEIAEVVRKDETWSFSFAWRPVDYLGYHWCRDFNERDFYVDEVYETVLADPVEFEGRWR